MNTCQRKKQSYNHLSNISFSPFYTVSEYNQRRTVKLFDCDLSSSQNQTLQPFSIKGSLEVWSDFFSFHHLRDIIGTERERLECLVLWRLWLVYMRETQLTWPSWASSNLVIHLTIWIVNRFYIYDTGNQNVEWKWDFLCLRWNDIDTK